MISEIKWCLMFLFFVPFNSVSQSKSNNAVYVDKEGVLRYSFNNKEATFFGVNYTVPFAYGYRSHKALGVEIEKAIDADVYHMSRLGFNAFRVHLWDVELSDSAGNLLNNVHLRLFDYLLFKLKEKGIKALLTPIAFWGNGYPEPDIKTNAFSYKYGKGGAVVDENAFIAQENYLKQFFAHVNPYTKLKYQDDPDIIAMEINNEPHHNGPKERATEYVNRMAAVVRSTGWTKPIYYNISESPRYADAVVASKVDGHSFQWYPTGLVANHERKGNFLPHVDKYTIPFHDTIPAFNKRSLMVYEFDAGDVMQPIMYPAMVRSYRAAGFQWATQFAYDPMYTAHSNTEYQTHYLNLAYTPAKAISLMIASEIFHRVPRKKNYGSYPADTMFSFFKISYHQQLSEMNSPKKFYYTGSTSTNPLNTKTLINIAGTGSSSIIKYEGTGTYFLDKKAEGVWRLEVMPDAISIKDPFERASPQKLVTAINWQWNNMEVELPDLGKDFSIIAASHQNTRGAESSGTGFRIYPGVYYLVRKGKEFKTSTEVFYAPEATKSAPIVVHTPFKEVTANKSYTITATIVGVDSMANIYIESRNSVNTWRRLQMKKKSAYTWTADVPKELVSPGLINYRIMVHEHKGDTISFPGAITGNPYAWDEYRYESFSTYVAGERSPIEIFEPASDRDKLAIYNTDWRNNTIGYITGQEPGELLQKLTLNNPDSILLGWQFYFADKIAGRKSEFQSLSKLIIRARATESVYAHLALISTEANAYADTIQLNKEWKDYVIPFSKLKNTSYLLLPRPYPGFLPLKFQSSSRQSFDISKMEKLEFVFGNHPSASPLSIEIATIRLVADE